MNIISMKKNRMILPVVLTTCFSLVGCGSGGDYYDDGYSYRSEQYRQDEMAREAMEEATDSMSNEDLRNLERDLKRSQE